MSIPQPRRPGDHRPSHPHPGHKPPNRSCIVILIPMLITLSGLVWLGGYMVSSIT